MKLINININYYEEEELMLSRRLRRNRSMRPTNCNSKQTNNCIDPQLITCPSFIFIHVLVLLICIHMHVSAITLNIRAFHSSLLIRLLESGDVSRIIDKVLPSCQSFSFSTLVEPFLVTPGELAGIRQAFHGWTLHGFLNN